MWGRQHAEGEAGLTFRPQSQTPTNELRSVFINEPLPDDGDQHKMLLDAKERRIQYLEGMLHEANMIQSRGIPEPPPKSVVRMQAEVTLLRQYRDVMKRKFSELQNEHLRTCDEFDASVMELESKLEQRDAELTKIKSEVLKKCPNNHKSLNFPERTALRERKVGKQIYIDITQNRTRHRRKMTQSLEIVQRTKQCRLSVSPGQVRVNLRGHPLASMTRPYCTESARFMEECPQEISLEGNPRRAYGESAVLPSSTSSMDVPRTHPLPLVHRRGNSLSTRLEGGQRASLLSAFRDCENWSDQGRLQITPTRFTGNLAQLSNSGGPPVAWRGSFLRKDERSRLWASQHDASRTWHPASVPPISKPVPDEHNYHAPTAAQTSQKLFFTAAEIRRYLR